MGHMLVPGEFSVQLHSGQDLKNCDWFGQQDPYVILRCGNQQYRSNTHVSGGINPVWNQVFVFKVKNETELSLDVYDKDDWKADDCVGRATVSLTEVRQAPSRLQELRVPLRRPLTRRHQGFLHLTLSFIPDAAPASLADASCSHYSLPQHTLPQHTSSFSPSVPGAVTGRLSSNNLLGDRPSDRPSWLASASGLPTPAHRPGEGGLPSAGSWRLEDAGPFHTSAAPLPVRPSHHPQPPLPAAPPQGASHAPPYQGSSSAYFAASGYPPELPSHYSQPAPGPSTAGSGMYPQIQPGPVLSEPPGPSPYPLAVHPHDAYGAGGSSCYGNVQGSFQATPPPGYPAPPTYSAYGAPPPYGAPPRHP